LQSESCDGGAAISAQGFFRLGTLFPVLGGLRARTSAARKVAFPFQLKTQRVVSQKENNKNKNSSFLLEEGSFQLEREGATLVVTWASTTTMGKPPFLLMRVMTPILANANNSTIRRVGWLFGGSPEKIGGLFNPLGRGKGEKVGELKSNFNVWARRGGKAGGYEKHVVGLGPQRKKSQLLCEKL